MRGFRTGSTTLTPSPGVAKHYVYRTGSKVSFMACRLFGAQPLSRSTTSFDNQTTLTVQDSARIQVHLSSVNWRKYSRYQENPLSLVAEMEKSFWRHVDTSAPKVVVLTTYGQSLERKLVQNDNISVSVLYWKLQSQQPSVCDQNVTLTF